MGVSVSWGVHFLGVLLIRGLLVWGLHQGPMILGYSQFMEAFILATEVPKHRAVQGSSILIVYYIILCCTILYALK